MFLILRSRRRRRREGRTVLLHERIGGKRDRAPARERPLLDANAPGEGEEVERREEEGGPPRAQCERQKRDLERDDEIVGVPQVAIGAAADERRLRQRDDPRRPIRAERGDGPEPQPLQSEEGRKRRPADRRLRRRAEEERRKPADMQRDDGGVMGAAVLLGSASAQGPGVARGPAKLAQTLQRDEAEEQRRGAHRLSSTMKPAVKPGPSALISMRRRTPLRSMRSSTKSTVTADMLP